MTAAFKWLQANESNIKQQLDTIIPDIKEQVSNINRILIDDNNFLHILCRMPFYYFHLHRFLFFTKNMEQ